MISEVVAGACDCLLIALCGLTITSLVTQVVAGACDWRVQVVLPSDGFSGSLITTLFEHCL